MNGINYGTEEAPSMLPVERQPMSIEEAKEKLKVYVEKIDSMVLEANALVVNTDSTNEAAVLIGTSAKQIYKKLEDQRKALIEEPSAFLKSVNAFCKIFTDKLSGIESTAKSKISQYRAVQEQARREAEAAARKATEDLQKKLDAEAKEKGTEPVKVEAPIVPKKETTTRTETGAAYGRKVWSFTIEDVNAVPREYMVPSDSKIRDAIKGGVREIAGVRIFEETKTSFRT